MRWYVSRQGETVGPVEPAQVTEWVRGGMTDAMVRDDAGGPWTAVLQSPFAPGGYAIVPHAPVMIQQIASHTQCRSCGAVGSKQVQTKITSGGWLFFWCMFLFCLPVAIFGLFQKENYALCSQCGSKAWG